MIPTADLPHRVTIRARTGTAGSGGPVFARPVRGVPARLEGRRRTVRTGTGDTVICSATAIIRPGVTVAKGSLVENGDDIFEVLDVLDAVDAHRLSHRELLLDGPRPEAA